MRKLHLGLLSLLLVLLTSCQTGQDFKNVLVDYIGSYQNEEYFMFTKFTYTDRQQVIRKTGDGEFIDVYTLEDQHLEVQYNQYLVFNDKSLSTSKRAVFDLYNIEDDTNKTIQLYVKGDVTEIIYMDDDNILFSSRTYNGNIIYFFIYDIHNDSIQEIEILKDGGASNTIAFVEDDTLFVNLYYHQEEDKYFYAYHLPSGAETLTIFEKNQYMIIFQNSSYYYLFPTPTRNNFSVLQLDNRWDQTDELKHLNYSFVYYMDGLFYEKQWYTNKIIVLDQNLIEIASIRVPSACNAYDIIDSTKYTCIVERNRGSIIRITDYKIYTYTLENELIYQSDWIGSGNQLEYWD